MNNRLTIFFIILICALNTNAQHKDFNLDFEIYEKGSSIPERWFSLGTYELGIDSVFVRSGKYSGTVISNETGNAFGCITLKIPANYKGKTIQLEGYIKTENVKYGYAGLLLRIDGGGKQLVFDNLQSENINGTIDWKKYTNTLSFPEDADFIYVGGLLVGKGQAWFDNFSITIDGVNIQTMKENIDIK